MRYNLDYKFFVNEQEFHGSGKHYPKDDTFSIGDTVIIVYDRLNPDNSKTYRDYVSSQEEAPFIMPFLILAGLLLGGDIGKYSSAQVCVLVFPKLIE